MLLVPNIVRIAYLLIATWSLVAHAQDVAEKPGLQVGDEWVFVQTGNEDGKPVNRRWRRRIVEMLPDDKFRVSPPARDVDVFDQSWNPRHPARPTFWPLDFQFPLRLGAEWSFASPVGVMDERGQNFDQRGHHKVVAIETIKVPAGTFRCFRIEGETSWIASYGGGNADFKKVDRWLMTRWYCPDVRFMAKIHIERDVLGSFVKAVHSELDSELVDFRRVAPVPSAAVPK